MWLATLGLPPGGLVMVNYLGLAIFALGLVGAVQSLWFQPRVVWWFGPPAALVLLSLYAPFDRYTVRWTKVYDPTLLTEVQTEVALPWDGPSQDVSWTEYRDRYRRWGRRLVYRWVASYDGNTTEDYWAAFHSQGRMSASGRPHGPWQMNCYNPPYAKDVWFWYGEEISEGEWHLRNK